MAHDNISEPAHTVSQLTASLAQAAQNQRALLQDMSSFAKDESVRFFNLRLERNEAALEKMQHCVGLPGLIGVQQEWLRDFVQDVIGQNMRFAGALRGAGHDAVATAHDNLDQAENMAHQGEQAFRDRAADAHNHLVDDERGYADIQH